MVGAYSPQKGAKIGGGEAFLKGGGSNFEWGGGGEDLNRFA